MFGAVRDHLIKEIQGIRDSGLYKAERIITSPQQARIEVSDGRRVLNMQNFRHAPISIDVAREAQRRMQAGEKQCEVARALGISPTAASSLPKSVDGPDLWPPPALFSCAA